MDILMNHVDDPFSYPTVSKPSLGTAPIKSYGQKVMVLKKALFKVVNFRVLY